MILAGDIGGTKINLAWFEAADGPLTCSEEATYLSRDYSSFEEVVEAFLASFPGQVTGAAFGVPGPVVNGRAETTNLKWTIDAAVIAHHLRLGSVGLINDLQATAYGLLRLPPGDLRILNRGVPHERGTIGVIAAGTGLGEGGLLWTASGYRAIASEGGHTDFGPRNETEMDLLRFLTSEFGRVSYERLVSGPGIRNLYRFFRERSGEPEPPWLAEAMTQQDASAAISTAGLEGSDPVCKKTLDTFISVYGAEAGNLALKILATGGMYVGGGIAPKLADAFEAGSFMEAFAAKGRYRGILSRMPVALVMNERTGLLGAAHFAMMK